MATEYGIEFHNVDFTYLGGSSLFQGLSWRASLLPGQVLGVLGRSGSGKSTLMRLLAGLELPDRGAIAVDGENITSIAPSRRNFVMVYQERTLFPGSVRFNLDFAMRCRRIPKEDRDVRCAHLLRLVGLQGHDNKAVQTLSGGERQRVELARALAAEPRLLLLDEPMGQLDAPLKKSLLEELRTWIGIQKLRAIYVTHDISEAFTIADTVAILDEGRLSEAAPGARLYLDPERLNDARMSGTLNELRGRARRISGRSIELKLESSHTLELLVDDHDPSWNDSPVTVAFRPSRIERSLTASDGFVFAGRVQGTRLLNDMLWGDISLKGAGPLSLSIALTNGDGDATSRFWVPTRDLLIFASNGQRISVSACRTLE